MRHEESRLKAAHVWVGALRGQRRVGRIGVSPLSPAHVHLGQSCTSFSCNPSRRHREIGGGLCVARRHDIWSVRVGSAGQLPRMDRLGRTFSPGAGSDAKRSVVVSARDVGFDFASAYGGMWALFAVALKKMWQDRPWRLIWMAPTLWVALEWIRVQLYWRFHWAVFGNTAADFPAIRQAAALGGPWLLSLLIVAVNCAVFLLLFGARPRRRNILPAGIMWARTCSVLGGRHTAPEARGKAAGTWTSGRCVAAP